MARTDQIVRVLTLAHALATSRRGLALRAFAKQRGFPERSVYNDFKTLEKAGFPIMEVSRGRYRLSDTWRPVGLPNVDADEALALFVARQLMGTMHSSSLGRALDRVWMKLAGAGPQVPLLPDTPPWLSVRAPIAIDYQHHRATIATLERALADRAVVRCRYRNARGEETARDLEPGALHWDPGLESLYLIAWCRLRQAVRIFAVHRFLAAELRCDTFAPRPETRSSVALKNAFRIWRSETVERVTLQLRGRAAADARERKWHASQRVTDDGPATVVLRLEVADTAELVPWLMAFGPDVSVVEPSGLANELADRHQEAADSVAAARGRRAPFARKTKRPKGSRGG